MVAAAPRVLDDGQAQAGAAGVGRAAGVDPVETLGEARDVLGLDARAAVLHRQVRALASRQQRMRISPPSGAVLDRVEHQVGEGAAQLRLAALEQHAGSACSSMRVAAFGGRAMGVAADALQQQAATATGRLSAG